jgi:hypothetical protein
MDKFETALDACLQALREGTADIETCLREHPQHAAALRPHLVTASKLIATYDGTQPSAEFARKARARFLLASGEKLRDAFDVDPTPSFFAAARVRFLMAAQGMKLNHAHAMGRRRLPLVGNAYRALAGAGAAAVLLLGLSTYTVAEASDSLPGDRLYGVKLQTERVRLALAFSESSERDVRLDIASERVDEIEQLTAKGKIIGPGVIERLQDQTEPLAADLDSLDKDELERVRSIAADSEAALERAKPQVKAEAQPLLAEVQAFAREAGIEAGVRAINSTTPSPVITPNVLLTTAEPTGTPEPTETPDASATSGDETPEPSPTPARVGVVVDQTPVGIAQGVTWVRIAVGRFSTLIPSPDDGWTIAGVNPALGTSTTPNLVSISNTGGTQIITMNPRNGDVYWFVSVNGVFDEVQLRSERDGQTFVADRELLTRLYGPLTDIPLYVLDHIEFAPEPTPQPSKTPSSTATPAQPTP